MNKFMFVVLLSLLSLSVNGYEKKDIEMPSKLLSNNFDLRIAVKDNNSFEKKKDDLYLTIRQPKFLLEDKDEALEKKSIAKAGIFHKKLSKVEINELKILAEYLVNNKNYIEKEGNVDVLVALKDSDNELSGEFVADEDQLNSLFLRKRFLFESSQLANLENFQPIEAIQIRHELQTMPSNSLKVTVYIKNIGQKDLEVYSPYAMLDMPAPAPHMWYGVFLQLFLVDNNDPDMPDGVITLSDSNIIDENIGASKPRNSSPLILLPQKERAFEFLILKEQLNEVLQDLSEEKQLNSRVTLAFPFKIDDEEFRLEIATDEQPFISQ